MTRVAEGERLGSRRKMNGMGTLETNTKISQRLTTFGRLRFLLFISSSQLILYITQESIIFSSKYQNLDHYALHGVDVHFGYMIYKL